MGITVAAVPAPKPAAVRPAARPRRSGNHLSALPTQVPYTAPAPIPDKAAATYNSHNEPATEFRAQAQATKTPPKATTTRGPNRSTNHPSIGTSHVSVAMKMLKAN